MGYSEWLTDLFLLQNYQKNGKQFDYPYEGVVKFLDRCLANECVDEQD